jgi:hypothetical protein
MVKYNKKILEGISALEHERWLEWSQHLAEKEKLSKIRMTRWKKLWLPYDKLPPRHKYHVRQWGKKIYDYFSKVT